MNSAEKSFTGAKKGDIEKIYEHYALASKVYQELMEDGHASAATVGSHLGISDRMVRKHISVLRDAGIIERVGGNKTGYWKLLKK